MSLEHLLNGHRFSLRIGTRWARGRRERANSDRCKRVLSWRYPGERITKRLLPDAS
jgi:hypothetical protein